MRNLFKPFLALMLAAALWKGAMADSLPTAPSDERFVAGQALALDIPLDTASFLAKGYPIDSAGFVDFPVVGRVQVADRTRGQVEEFLAQRLSNYLKDTHLRAIPAIRITFLGHWTHQGQYYVSPDATVWEAAHMAGGIAGERNIGKITVIRGEKPVEISFLDAYSQGKTLAAAGFRSGDIVIIPVPRDNAGFWYWFRETIGVTAQLASVFSTILTAYITYLIFQQQN